MPRTFKPAQPFNEGTRPPIALTRVDSEKIHSLGHDGVNALAVRFYAPGQKDIPASERDGGDAIYYYALSAVQHAAFIGSDSLGRHFGEHIAALPFEKYHADPALLT